MANKDEYVIKNCKLEVTTSYLLTYFLS